MPKKALLFVLALTTLLLTACGPSATAPTAAPATEVPATSATVAAPATAAPTAAAATQEPTPMQEPTVASDMNILDTLFQRYQEAVMPIAMTCPQRTFPLPDPEKSVKRPLDFAPYGTALLNFSSEQATTISAAVDGKTIPEIQALMADGQLSAEQLVLYYLARIQQYDEGRLNSVMELNPAALTIAQELDAERAAGTVRGPLHGIPVLLKDNIATGDGMHTTAGNYALKDWQADRDAFLVTQLREAGAIILGKNNLSEWANYTDPCMPNGFSALGGQTRNPHGPYDTLGSSSGSAASVAAGLTTVSVGSETAGSLVQPSRANGVVGMRPSKGLVSGDYIIPLEPTLDTAGPMGRSVTDVAVLLSALAASDPNEPRAADAAALADTDFTQYLSLDEARTLRVGVVQFDASARANIPDFDQKSPEEQQQILDLAASIYFGATQAQIDALKSQGIEVVLIKQSELVQSLDPSYIAFINYGFNDGINRFFGAMEPPAPIRSLSDAIIAVDEDPASRAPYGQRYVQAAATTSITADEYDAAVDEARRRADAWITSITTDYNVDVLIVGRFYTTAGSAGTPTINIPAGQGTDPDTGAPSGPTGVYITGPYLSDAKLIAVGYALEQALNVRLTPDLETTIKAIDAVTGR